MTSYWEINAFIYILIGLSITMAIMIFLDWYRDWKKWKSVPRHLGTTYNASSDKTYRPNVDLRRVR